MIHRIERRLQTRWAALRRRAGLAYERPLRLAVEKTRWLHDTASPVMLSIDDLTNAWHGNGRGWDQGGDWGGGHWKKGSALRFLESRLLNDFPEVRTTFFTVAGPISPYTRHQPFSFAASLDASVESSVFFRSLVEDERMELAYHGLDHGVAGASTEQFVQEWAKFESIDAAVDQTRKGLQIFERATGRQPSGGKYGGWAYNEFAEPALDRLGFSWWCRDWMPRDVTGRVSDRYYEPHRFGSNGLVALPTTVHGRFWDQRQLDTLLARQQLISIEEHIAPVRPDGLVQTPNIVDDIGDLRRLFSYLRGKDVWYATGSQVARYVAVREGTTVTDVTGDDFVLKYDAGVPAPQLTLRIDCSAICDPEHPLIDVVIPDRTGVHRKAFHFDPVRYNHMVTLPVANGRYAVRACSN